MVETKQLSGPYRRPSWVSYRLPGTEINGKQDFPTKGKAKRFIRLLRKNHGAKIEIERSWIAEVR